MKRDEKFLLKAIEKAKTSEHHFPMGAILAKGNRIVSSGVNQFKTHPKQKLRYNCDHTPYGGHKRHAEIDCILRAPYTMLEQSTLYVARVIWSSDEIGIAKPCPVCTEIIKQAGIKRVVFTLSTSKTSQIWYKSIKF